MDKLNEYLQTLVSTSGYELHLEPNKNPYVVSASGQKDITNVPMLGTQISMMVFPLIPPAVKQELPSQPEVSFSHPHVLGGFDFVVRKSPAGFNVTIRPCSEVPPAASYSPATPEFANGADSKQPEAPAASNYSYISDMEVVSPVAETQTFSIESPLNKPADELARSEFNVAAPSFAPDKANAPEDPVKVVSMNDPSFTTTFSDTSTYEESGRPHEYRAETSFDPQPIIRPSVSINTGVEIQTSAPTYIPETSFSKPRDATEIQPEPVTENVRVTIPPVADVRVPTAAITPANPAMRARMDAMFRKMSELGASDLHLSVSVPPMIRKDGKMQPMPCAEPTLTPALMRDLLTSIMPDRNREEFEEKNDTDFAYEIEGLARFRANIFADRKGMGGVFRIIPSKILTAEQLGLSKAIMDLCALSKGLVVVTGPTGSGKSTTLCAMVDSINKNREDHIITIEDPIEFTHDNQRCLVNQREVGNHTDSFKNALRAALREDPDILLVGEMRDLETISIAIETAETGHLVFGTLHTTTAASTVDRIIDQFPADRQQQIRVMLSESLKGVIAQTLLPKKGGGRVAALEVLIVTPAISNLIREGKTFQIQSSMQTGKQQGMVLLNDALLDLVKKGLVEPRDAYIKAVDKTGFESLLQRAGITM